MDTVHRDRPKQSGLGLVGSAATSTDNAHNVAKEHQDNNPVPNGDEHPCLPLAVVPVLVT